MGALEQSQAERELLVRRLWVPPADLAGAVALFQQHEKSGRVRARDHVLAHRDVPAATIPNPSFRPVSDETRRTSEKWKTASPMTAVDRMFVAILETNSHLRPRVGNPDEMLSNRLVATLGRLKFRVTEPEPAVPECVDGAVITALNEEAVSAALANKGGINLAHTYEAFGTKMHGAMRQEIIFANHCLEADRPQRWLSIPLIRRLSERRVAHTVVYLFEPGRFRAPRSEHEQAHGASPDVTARLYPSNVQARLFVTHTRPETLLGVLGPLHTGPATVGLGYTNHGGTLSTQGMVFVNRCSWAHCLREAGRLLQLPEADLLSTEERQALDGKRSPHGVIIPEV